MDCRDRRTPSISRAPAPDGHRTGASGFEGPGFVRLSLMVNTVFAALVAVEAGGAVARPLAGGERPAA